MSKLSLPLDQQLCFALYSANNAMGRLYRPFLSQLNLTYPQYLVLLALWERDQRKVKELGQQLQLDSNTLTPLLKRMEQNGFVARQRSQEDERSVIVSLTDKGRETEAHAHDIGLCVTRAGGDDLEHLERLREHLQALAEDLRKAT